MNETSSRRGRALLASGAVLGLGAAGTLAVWSDSEFATSLFRAAPSFVVQSAATADGPFESHDAAADAVRLNFPIPTEGLTVGEPVAAEFWLRMASETTGSVSVLSPTIEFEDLNGLIDITVAQGSCDSAGQELQEGLLEEVADAPEAFTLPAGSGGSPGEVQAVCITATLNDISDLPPGEYSTGRVGWEFLVTEEVA